MHCYNHAGLEATARCCACAEPFCGSCLVNVGGMQYCESCKVIAVEISPPAPGSRWFYSVNVSGTLWCGLLAPLIGVFPFFGIMLAIGAFNNAKQVLNDVERDRAVLGWGLAVGARVSAAVMVPVLICDIIVAKMNG